uniref:Uncharacterized protein n=1 Tax=Cacopsylla melanoneura TaxID=428564 RepID=A0A8D9A1E3_9HEMI
MIRQLNKKLFILNRTKPRTHSNNNNNKAADVLRRDSKVDNYDLIKDVEKHRLNMSEDMMNTDTRTNHDKTKVAVKSTPGVKAKTGKLKAKTEMSPQLLHPLWRRIPHRTLYGWSEQHQRLENVLYKKITEDPSMTSMYYPSEAVYTEEQTKCGPGIRFLARPIVSSVEEVLTLLKYYEDCPKLLPKTPTYEEVFKLDEEEEDGEHSSDVESGYDGDDE